MSFSNRDGVIWFDGELRPWREATVHVLTHSLHYRTSGRWRSTAPKAWACAPTT